MYEADLWGSWLHFSAYELAMLVLGLALLLGVMIPQMTLKRFYTFPLIFMGMGALLFGLHPDLHVPVPFSPSSRLFWERLTETVVVISLVGAGLKIDQRKHGAWTVTLRLLLVTMPICIVLMTWLGSQVLGLGFAAALLLGAILAPTDPVLAGDLQVGPPNQGDGNRVRFALTSEAGLNDGLAFPFVYLAIAMSVYGWDSQTSWFSTWMLRDVLYRVIVGVVMGALLGRVLGFLFYCFPKKAPIAESSMGVFALCLFFVVYGATELLGGYGFIAAFVGAFVVRRYAYKHEYNNTLFGFTENLEHGITVLTLFVLGGLAVSVWPWITLNMVILSLLLIVVVRPLAGMVGMLGCTWPWQDKAAISFYGIRGLGSIYYLAYALGHGSFTQTTTLWATLITVLVMSSLLHGLSAIPVMQRIDRYSKDL